MPYEIQITNPDNKQIDPIVTTGYLLLYFNNEGRILANGQINAESFEPMLKDLLVKRFMGKS
jgi:hypothetical protein